MKLPLEERAKIALGDLDYTTESLRAKIREIEKQELAQSEVSDDKSEISQPARKHGRGGRRVGAGRPKLYPGEKRKELK